MGDLTKNLSREEFACQCEYSDCTRTPVDFDLPTLLQDCVDHFAYLEKGHSQMFKRVACKINSGYRCEKHNEDITDGKGSGIHTTGMAADFKMSYVYGDGSRKRVPEEEIAEYLERRYPDSMGIGRYPREDGTGRVHFDVRPDGPARWKG